MDCLDAYIAKWAEKVQSLQDRGKSEVAEKKLAEAIDDVRKAIKGISCRSSAHNWIRLKDRIGDLTFVQYSSMDCSEPEAGEGFEQFYSA